MKKSTIIWIVVIVVLGLLVWRSTSTPATSAPATDTSAQSTSQPAAATTQPAASAPTPAPKTMAVSISNFSFSPNTLNVPVGTTVVWTNHDSMTHTVTSFPGGPMSGNLAKGASYSFTFNKQGTVNYHCAIHPGMTGTIFVGIN